MLCLHFARNLLKRFQELTASKAACSSSTWQAGACAAAARCGSSAACDGAPRVREALVVPALSNQQQQHAGS